MFMPTDPFPGARKPSCHSKYILANFTFLEQWDHINQRKPKLEQLAKKTMKIFIRLISVSNVEQEDP